MTRLTHSFGAFRRYLQMSRNQMFIFVEGKNNDPYFYGKICKSALSKEGVSYQIIKSNELPGSSGGKTTLLSFFEYLRSNHSLVDSFGGKRTLSIFFLDKDIDDILRTKRRSPHVVYTEYYDVESYIFREGKLAEAAAAIASVDIQLMESIIPDGHFWRRQAAHTWKEWVTLCVFSHKRRLRTGCNYGSNSLVNSPVCGPLDHTQLSSRIHQLQANSGLIQKQFDRAYKRTKKYITNLYLQDLHDKVFKGKWYSIFLDNEIKKVLPASNNGLARHIPSALLLTIDFEGSWSEHLKLPLRQLLSLL